MTQSKSFIFPIDSMVIFNSYVKLPVRLKDLAQTLGGPNSGQNSQSSIVPGLVNSPKKLMGKSPFFVGKSTINLPFSVDMLVYQLGIFLGRYLEEEPIMLSFLTG